MVFRCPHIRRALATLPSGYSSSNKQIIAEAIRDNLNRSRKAHMLPRAATERVLKMLRDEFVNITITRPFQLHDIVDFGTWNIGVQYPVGPEIAVTNKS